MSSQDVVCVCVCVHVCALSIVHLPIPSFEPSLNLKGKEERGRGGEGEGRGGVEEGRKEIGGKKKQRKIGLCPAINH